MSKEIEKLKSIAVGMRDFALNRIDIEFPNETEIEKETRVYSLFNHGLYSQRDFLEQFYKVDIVEQKDK